MTLDKLTWEENVSRHENGSLLFPTTMRSRDEKGNPAEIPICMRVPTPGERFMARPEARAWGKSLKLDEVADKDIFEHLENFVILSYALRDFKSGAQLKDKEEIAQLDQGCIIDLKEKLAHFTAMLDPRVAITSDEEFWKVIGDMYERRNLLPLADIVSHEQPSFILRMARELHQYRTTSSQTQSFLI